MRLTSVSVEADGGVEAFAVLQDVQSEQDLWTLALLLDAIQGALQVQPEADLLQGRPRGRVTGQFGDLVEEEKNGETLKGTTDKDFKCTMYSLSI